MRSLGYLADSLRALATSLQSALRKPVTVQFPAEIRPRGERFRTSFALPYNEHGELACIACLACERICPSEVITMKSSGKKESPATGKKRAYADEFVLDLSACIFCELCVQVCPEDAIIMLKVPEAPTYSREELVLPLDRLVQNWRDRAHSWGTGARLMEMQEPPKPPKPPVAVDAPVTAPAPEGSK